MFKIWAISIFLFRLIVNFLKAFSENQDDHITELPLPLYELARGALPESTESSKKVNFVSLLYKITMKSMF